MSDLFPRRYAICGVSARAIGMFLKPMVSEFTEYAEPVALLDIDPLRFKIAKEDVPQIAGVPEYKAEEFDKMVAETKPDVILALGMDCTHVTYILQGLAHDLDVVSEKPMATTSEDCRRIVAAEKRSKGKVICSFNYRYPAIHRKMREMILAGAVGRVTNVDLSWYIDTQHGASYFKRWNRIRANSGGLSIHKASHHFDLVNWLIDGVPDTVHAFGALNYYGPDGEYNPSRKDGRTCGDCAERAKCRYYRRWATRSSALKVVDDHIGAFAGSRKQYTDYRPDRCIFDSAIDIEDTYVANIRYANGALLNYSCNFSMPYEGYRLAINGTKGRIETQEWHAPFRTPFPIEHERQYIDYFPIFGSQERFYAVENEGGHGGGDPLIREDIFIEPDPERPYAILSGAQEAWHSVAIGEAVWRSVKEEQIIHLDFSLD
ncbi:MAG: Gfo/Idh/MocA family oxidoreductase [Lentisphaeria bacterium]|nr:Gfo/Idh/MocA family oxidoreductase [Lentisphaeria bacterium]